jgi:hypothetical protein
MGLDCQSERGRLCRSGTLSRIGYAEMGRNGRWVALGARGERRGREVDGARGGSCSDSLTKRRKVAGVETLPGRGGSCSDSLTSDARSLGSRRCRGGAVAVQTRSPATRGRWGRRSGKCAAGRLTGPSQGEHSRRRFVSSKRRRCRRHRRGLLVAKVRGSAALTMWRWADPRHKQKKSRRGHLEMK